MDRYSESGKVLMGDGGDILIFSDLDFFDTLTTMVRSTGHEKLKIFPITLPTHINLGKARDTESRSPVKLQEVR